MRKSGRVGRGDGDGTEGEGLVTTIDDRKYFCGTSAADGYAPEVRSRWENRGGGAAYGLNWGSGDRDSRWADHSTHSCVEGGPRNPDEISDICDNLLHVS